MHLMTGVPQSWLYRPGAIKPVSHSGSAAEERALMFELAPGGSAVLPLLVGMDSYDSHVGYVLATGDYELLAVLEFTDTGEPTKYFIRSPRVPISLV
jgi:hypothetical protein